MKGAVGEQWEQKMNEKVERFFFFIRTVKRFLVSWSMQPGQAEDS